MYEQGMEGQWHFLGHQESLIHPLILLQDFWMNLHKITRQVNGK